MIFFVIDADAFVSSRDSVHLVPYQTGDVSKHTTYSVYFTDSLLHTHSLGEIRIGIAEGNVQLLLPKQFTALDDRFFSLGQDDAYYANLQRFGITKREQILTALKDVAFDLDHFYRNETVEMMQNFLLEHVSAFAVTHQLHRIAMGGARLSHFQFSYTVPRMQDHPEAGVNKIAFDVVPESNPPTNIHVLIGRNGSGKTRLIQDMIRSIRSGCGEYGQFEYEIQDETPAGQARFANILSIAFSPFDDFSSLENIKSAIPYSYIGLNKQHCDLLQEIAEQFWSAFTKCMGSQRKRKLWLECIQVLESDPTFADADVQSFVDNGNPLREKDRIMECFSHMSSGHKVVLLSVTCCVEKIEERSIVFLDEPENHLHPPLLAAWIRALSNLLVDRNGVAIISTHSPVVMQEVPRDCAWVLNRVNQYLNITRPSIQTFGATISALTNDVFGLEVTQSGFHKLLEDAANKNHSYRAIFEKFNGQLGTEADILLRMLTAPQLVEDI